MSGNIDQSDIDWFLYKMSPLEIDKGVSVAACCMAPILGIDSSQWNLFHCLCGGFAGVNVWIVLFPSPVRWVEKTIRSPWNEANRKLQASKIFCICTMQWLPITRKKKKINIWTRMPFLYTAQLQCSWCQKYPQHWHLMWWSTVDKRPLLQSCNGSHLQSHNLIF